MRLLIVCFLIVSGCATVPTMLFDDGIVMYKGQRHLAGVGIVQLQNPDFGPSVQEEENVELFAIDALVSQIQTHLESGTEIENSNTGSSMVSVTRAKIQAKFANNLEFRREIDKKGQLWLQYLVRESDVDLIGAK